jgi:hypothetical protein
MRAVRRRWAAVSIVGVLITTSRIAHATALIEWGGVDRPLWVVAGVVGALALIWRKVELGAATAIYALGFAKLLKWVLVVELGLELVARAFDGFADGARTLLTLWGAGQAGLLVFLWGCTTGHERAQWDGRGARPRAPVWENLPTKGAPPDQGRTLAKVAWMPKEPSCPAELVAVTVPPGLLTERLWWQALSERVRLMAVAAGPDATYQACRTLGPDVAWTRDPDEAGQCLVEGNLNLRIRLRTAMKTTQFPVSVAEGDPDALAAIEESDLQGWAELAAAELSAANVE